MKIKEKKKVKQKNKILFNPKILIFITIILLLIVSLSTRYYGYIDIEDYTNTAKYFAGEYPAKVRSAHSLWYGLIHAPFVKLTNNFIFFKISSVLWLSLLIISLYYISHKNKKTLFLFLISPIIWYMGPWANSIQLSSLLFLWGWFFIRKYDEKERIKYLLLAGLLAGLSWIFWDAIIYFAVILAISFLYNKKAIHFLYFIIFFLVGSIPRFVLDQILFGFAPYSFLKHFFALASFALYGGIYGQASDSIFHIFNIISVLFILPFFIFTIYKKNIFIKNKKTIIFITLSLIMLLLNNSEIRYLLIIYPMILLVMTQSLNKRQFKKQIILFLILSLLIINLHLIQTKYDTNFPDFNHFVKEFPNYKMTSDNLDPILIKDLNSLAKEYPNQVFLVGNEPDNYDKLAGLYWGDDIKELISIQDYELFLQGNPALAGKTVCSASKIWGRRDICMSVELRKTIADETDYDSINYAISFEETLNIENFEKLEEFDKLYLFKKTA